MTTAAFLLSHSIALSLEQVDTVTLATLKPLLLFLQQYCFRQSQYEQQLKHVVKAFAGALFPAAFAAGAAV